MADLKTRFKPDRPPQEGPKSPPRGAPKRSEVKRVGKLKITIFLGKTNVFALPDGPKEAPSGSQIAYGTSFGLEIYKNLVRESSERAPRPRRSNKMRS